MKITHKIAIGLSTGLLLAGILPALALETNTNANANANTNTNTSVNANASANTNVSVSSAKENSQEVKDNEENEDEDNENDVKNNENKEVKVNKEIDDFQDIEKEIKLKEVKYGDLKTYGDVVSILSSYQAELDKIKTNSSIVDQAKNLSDAEKALLAKLVKKHDSYFNSLDVRINDLSGQIKEMSDLLSPVSDKEISPSLKGLIFSALKDLRSQIKDVANLESLDMQILDRETS